MLPVCLTEGLAIYSRLYHGLLLFEHLAWRSFDTEASTWEEQANRGVLYSMDSPACTIEIIPVQTERVHFPGHTFYATFFLNALHIIHDRCFYSPLWSGDLEKMAMSLTTACMRWLGG